MKDIDILQMFIREFYPLCYDETFEGWTPQDYKEVLTNIAEGWI